MPCAIHRLTSGNSDRDKMKIDYSAYLWFYDNINDIFDDKRPVKYKFMKSS